MSDRIFLPGFTASADLTTKRYHVVKYTASKSVAAVTAEGDIPLGILKNVADASGAVAEVQIFGQCQAMVGEAVAAGQRLCVGAAGRLMLANSGSRCIAIALTDGSADGSIIDVFVNTTATGNVLA